MVLKVLKPVQVTGGQVWAELRRRILNGRCGADRGLQVRARAGDTGVALGTPACALMGVVACIVQVFAPSTSAMCG